jgi:hypothetical protein
MLMCTACEPPAAPFPVKSVATRPHSLTDDDAVLALALYYCGVLALCTVPLGTMNWNLYVMRVSITVSNVLISSIKSGLISALLRKKPLIQATLMLRLLTELSYCTPAVARVVGHSAVLNV